MCPNGPQQLLETSKFYSIWKMCGIEKTLGGYNPLGSPKVIIEKTNTGYSIENLWLTNDLKKLNKIDDKLSLVYRQLDSIGNVCNRLTTFVYCNENRTWANIVLTAHIRPGRCSFSGTHILFEFSTILTLLTRKPICKGPLCSVMSLGFVCIDSLHFRQRIIA